MRDMKKRAFSNACYWLNNCYNLGVAAEEIAAYCLASREENKKGAKWKKRALSNACYWLNKCFDLGVASEEIAAHCLASREAASRKENKEVAK